MGAAVFTLRFCWSLASGPPSGPSFDQITAMFTAASTGGQYGTFTAPRVVRFRNGTCAWDVIATSVLTWPSNDAQVSSPVIERADTLLYDAAEAARRSGGGWSFTKTHAPFNAAVNGDLSWWTSGQASNSRTRTNWDSVISTDANENPIGPDHLVPRQGPPDLSGSKSTIVAVLGAAAVVAGAVTLIYYGPQIKAYLSRGEERRYLPPPYARR